MTEERDFVAEATRQGWREDGPLDAQAFVEKGDEIAGVVKKHNKELKTRIEQLEQSNREFGKYQSNLLKKEKAKSADALQELEAARAEAINAGDGQEFTRLDKEIDRTKQTMNEPEPGFISEEQWGQMTSSWLGKNNWYNEDPILQTFADGLVDKITSEGYTGANYYTEVTRRTKEAFPDKFSNPKKDKANGVEAGRTQDTVSKAKEHSYDNLDKESQAACDRFVADGLITEKEYVESYDW